MDVDWLVSCIIDEELFITSFFYPAGEIGKAVACHYCHSVSVVDFDCSDRLYSTGDVHISGHIQ